MARAQPIGAALRQIGFAQRGAEAVELRDQCARQGGKVICIPLGDKRHETPEGAKVYQVQGPLFFGSAAGFSELFDPKNDPSLVIVDFAESRVADQSALTAIEAVAAKYEAAGKRLQLRHLSRDCHQLLTKAGSLIVDSDDDPDYEVAVDYSVRLGQLGGGH